MIGVAERVNWTLTSSLRINNGVLVMRSGSLGFAQQIKHNEQVRKWFDENRFQVSINAGEPVLPTMRPLANIRSINVIASRTEKIPNSEPWSPPVRGGWAWRDSASPNSAVISTIT
jgi:hypothetical protein